jgi:S1-C subfamily serine protease
MSNRSYTCHLRPLLRWFAASVLMFGLLPGCRHTMKPRWDSGASVSLAPELRRVGAIEVAQVPPDFFRGFTIATVPALPPTFRDDVAEVIRSAIRQSGGATDLPNAPVLRVSFEECSMDWRVTGVITSVVDIRLRAELEELDGEPTVFLGSSTDSYTAFSADVAVNSDRQFNKALRQAIVNMLASRSGLESGTPYDAELRVFRRTLRELGDSLGGPGYGLGIALQSTTIAFPSPNAAACGVMPGDVVTELGGVKVGAALTPQQVARIEAEHARELRPLPLTVERSGVQKMLSCPPSADQWRAKWLSAVEREDWREALRILDVATQGTATSMTTIRILQLRQTLIRLSELRNRGSAGVDTLYASVALIQEMFDRAPFDPHFVRLNRTFILQTIDFSRALGADSVSADLAARLTAFDNAAASSSAGGDQQGARPSMVSRTSSGTGFLVSSDGALLTALHVVEDAESIEAVDVNGRIFRARLVGKLPDLDIALLEIDVRDAAYLLISAVRQPESGDQVFTIGFPASELLGTEPKFSDGVISSLSGVRGDRSRLQMTVPIQPGNSGGPLVDVRGEAVGLVVSSAAAAAFYRETGALPQNVNFAVYTVFAKALLEGRQAGVLPPAESREAAIERTRQAIFRVIAR